MTRAIEAMKQFLDELKWAYEVVELGLLRGVVNGDNGRWLWAATAQDGGDFLQLHGIMPVNVPRARRALVGEFLHRANWGLRWGNFEIDPADGEVRFKTSLPLDGRRAPTRKQLENLLFGNCWAMDRYLPGLMKVIYGEASPESAVEEADADLQSDQNTEEAPPPAPPTSSPLKPFGRMLPSEN